MKHKIKCQFISCDDSTDIVMAITIEEFRFLGRLEALVNKMAHGVNQPTMNFFEVDEDEALS